MLTVRNAQMATMSNQRGGSDVVQPCPLAMQWIEVVLVGEDDLPVAGVAYRVCDAGGKVVSEGTLDATGRARVEALRGGIYDVSFPTLDRDAWEPV